MSLCKKILYSISIFVLILVMVGLWSCDDTGAIGVPGYVMNLQLLAAPDGFCLSVMWDEPTLGSQVINGYRVYFRPFNDTLFTVLADSVTNMYYHHDPYDWQTHEFVTGDYCVVAFNDNGEGDAVCTLTTIPVYHCMMTLGEFSLHSAFFYPGYGWDRVMFHPHSYSMIKDENADSVDFYLTDQDTGWSGPSYYLVSPHYNDSIPADSAEIPAASWRVTGLTICGPDFPHFVPDGLYYESLMMIQEGMYYFIFTEDGHFALVEVFRIDSTTGKVDINGWIQPVKGLRLMRWYQ